jgi:hypothetical protein
VVIGEYAHSTVVRALGCWGWDGTGCAGSRPMIKDGCALTASPRT